MYYMTIKETVKKSIPKKLHPLPIKSFISIRSIRRLYFLFALKGTKYTCPFCGHSFCKFLPAGLNLKILNEKKL